MSKIKSDFLRFVEDVTGPVRDKVSVYRLRAHNAGVAQLFDGVVTSIKDRVNSYKSDENRADLAAYFDTVTAEIAHT